MARMLIVGLLTLAAGSSLAAQPKPQDLHAHLIAANQAQIVMLAEEELLPAEQAQRIADALRKAASEQNARGAARSPNYLVLEARLVELVGPEATNLHLGRSRNDLGATMNRMLLRERLLAQLERIHRLRGVLHKLTAAHHETVMPGFTHAVQAQPTTMAHFLLAMDASLDRDAQRLREIYARINQSPLGSGAFTTSSFALNRPRLAELLGFEGLVENAYDAIMVAPADSKVEYAAALGLSALNIGRFVQYIIFQYDAPVPGLLLAGDQTSRSSAMPQKRNPSALERLRLAASEVVANAQASALFVHNTPLYEVKDIREDHLHRLQRYDDEAGRMYDQLGRVLESLTIRKEILREQVDRDFSTMSEVAEVLHREAGVPFRTGYRVASELADFGREHGKRPSELSHADVEGVYRQVTGQALPLSAEQVQRAFDPAQVVESRRGRGGPQSAETQRMLGEQREQSALHQKWVQQQRQRLDQARKALDQAFNALADQSAP